MKVFRFYSNKLLYVFSGNTEETAKECLFEQFGEMIIDKVEEILEDQWDNKMINIWEDNDLSKKPFKVSIRELMSKDTPQLIYTNDLYF